MSSKLVNEINTLMKHVYQFNKFVYLLQPVFIKCKKEKKNDLQLSADIQ